MIIFWYGWKERFHKNLAESKKQSKYRKRFSIINFKEKKRFYFMRYFYKLLISSKLFKDVEEIKIKKNIYFFTIGKHELPITQFKEQIIRNFTARWEKSSSYVFQVIN